MELTILGANGTYPSATGACSGYLVRHDGFSLWMDAGNGTLSKLQRHLPVLGADALFISHAHPDHCADLFPYFYALLNEPDRPPTRVYSAVGVHDKLATLIGDESKERFRTRLDWHELEPGDVTEVGPFRITAFDAAHSITNVSPRIEADGHVLAYSGDTGPNDHLVDAARDADLFLCEASWLESDIGLMEPIHLRASEAGEAGRRADAKRLVLTHIWPRNDLSLVREQAGEAYGRDVELAVETETFEVIA